MNIMILKASGSQYWYNPNATVSNPRSWRYFGCVFRVIGEDPDNSDFWLINAAGTHMEHYEELRVLKADCEETELQPSFNLIIQGEK